MTSNKKIIALSIGTAIMAVSSAFAGDAKLDTSVYGFVKKEIRYLDQDSNAGKRKFAVGTDVDGAESRVGAMGKYENFMAKAELGVNSGMDDGTERIRIRLAHVKYSDPWGGAFILGKDFDPVSMEFQKVDSLTGTGFQALGGDMAAQVLGFHKKMLGYNYRGFNNEVSYTTPALFGFTYTATYDRSDTGINATSSVVQFNSMVKYTGDYGDNKVMALFNYGAVHKEKSDHWSVAGRYSYTDFGVGFVYGQEGAGAKTTTNHQRYIVSADYKWEKFKFALTFANSVSIALDAKAAEIKGADMQIAAGTFYNFTDNVIGHVALGDVTVDNKGVAITGATGGITKNTGMGVATGLTVKF